MQYVVYGAGAVGGIIGAQLHLAGRRVTFVARGEHLQLIQSRGLFYDTANGRQVLKIPAVGGASELAFDDQTVVLVCVKAHQTSAALNDLQANAPSSTAVVCVQNGVTNEREVLRRFSRTYGTCVIVPGTFVEPGTVVLDAIDSPGILDIGRFPSGTDAVTAAVSTDLRAASFACAERSDIMAWKYRKLVSNTANAVDAMCVPNPAASELTARAQAEADFVVSQAGIGMVSDDADRQRRAGLMQMRPGARTAGGSSRQSLLRGATITEVDYLTGEIVLIGRMHEIPTPVNSLIQQRATAAAHLQSGACQIDAAELLDELAREQAQGT